MEITLSLENLETLYEVLSKNEHAKDKNSYLKFNIYGVHLAERFDNKETFSEVVEGFTHVPEENKILDMSETWIYLDGLTRLIEDIKKNECVGIILRTNATCAFVISWDEGETTPTWYVDDFPKEENEVDSEKSTNE